MSVQRPEIPRRRLLKLGAALGAAALALLAVAGACSEEEDPAQETPTPQHTQTATATPSRTLAPLSTPTPQSTAAATPQPTTATPEVAATSTATEEPTEDPTPTPAATETATAETPTPEPLEFPDIPAAPDGLSGEASLADLMSYVDSVGPIETKDFGLSEAARPGELRRIGFAIEIRKPGGIWLPGDQGQFEHRRDDFLKWFAERRNLSGDDCLHVYFSKPPSATMLYTGIDRRVACPGGPAD